MILTDYGKEAIAAAMVGDTVISFTSLKTTDSPTIIIPVGDKPDFSRIKQSVAPSRISFDENTNTAVVSGLFSNEGLGAAYTILGVGLYATCAGAYTQNTEALFAYETFVGRGDYMPLPTDFPQSYTYQFNTTITDGDALDITIAPGIYASAADLMELTNLVHTNEPRRTPPIRCNATVADTSLEDYSWSQEYAIQGMTEDYWVDVAITSGSHNTAIRVESLQDKVKLYFVAKPATSLYVTVTYFKTYS